MASKWTVTPEVDRYELFFQGEPFSLDLKRALNTGETKRLYAAGFRSWSKRQGGTSDDEVELNVNWDHMIFEKVRTWLADWSLTNDKGIKLPRDMDGLRALIPELFTVIENAVDDHIKKRNDAREAAQNMSDDEKKVTNLSTSGL